MARARLTIDLKAIVANWRALDALSAPRVETGAVVKSDAYGLGVAAVAPALAAAGVRSFFVAMVEEGAALREILGPGPAIHVFEGLMQGDARLFDAFDLVPCLNSARQVADFASLLPGRPCTLQLNSGMNRLGLDAPDLAVSLSLVPRIAPILVLSHLACGDEPGHPMNQLQADRFAGLVGGYPGIRASLAATGGILLGARYHHGLTRPGIGLYGGLPFAAARPVVGLELPVIQVRELEAGEPVGYGATWIARRPSRIATVAAGYADGLPRALSGRGVALYADGRPCPIVGRISMDLITVDVSDLPQVPRTLEILNRQQTVDHLADAVGTIGYEILTSLGARYERVYKGAPQPPGPE